MNNCLIFTFKRWWKASKEEKIETYVAFRFSRVGWWPHFIWIKKLNNAEIENFVPEKYKTGLLFPPLFFKGKIIHHDVPLPEQVDQESWLCKMPAEEFDFSCLASTEED